MAWGVVSSEQLKNAVGPGSMTPQRPRMVAATRLSICGSLTTQRETGGKFSQKTVSCAGCEAAASLLQREMQSRALHAMKAHEMAVFHRGVS